MMNSITFLQRTVYFNNKDMARQLNIYAQAYADLTKKLSRETILRESAKNGELPLGYIIDCLKDDYGMVKTCQETWDVARKICNYFQL